MKRSQGRCAYSDDMSSYSVRQNRGCAQHTTDANLGVVTFGKHGAIHCDASMDVSDKLPQTTPGFVCAQRELAYIQKQRGGADENIKLVRSP